MTAGPTTCIATSTDSIYSLAFEGKSLNRDLLESLPSPSALITHNSAQGASLQDTASRDLSRFFGLCNESNVGWEIYVPTKLILDSLPKREDDISIPYLAALGSYLTRCPCPLSRLDSLQEVRELVSLCDLQYQPEFLPTLSALSQLFTSGAIDYPQAVIALMAWVDEVKQTQATVPPSVS